MRIAYHLGAHCTDEGAALRLLLRNRRRLQPLGIAVPEPELYPALLRATARVFAGHPFDVDAAEALLDQLLPNEAETPARRLVLSFEGFLGLPREAVTATQFYPGAAQRLAGLARLFPQGSAEFHLALRNPATFLPALSARRQTKGQAPLPEGFDATPLRWSELITRIRTTVPDAPLTIWCDEDTPLIWHEVLRAIAGHPEELELAHALDLPASLMTPVGARRMARWLAEARPITDAARRKGIAGFLDGHAIAERLEVTVDLPGWTDATVATLSDAYDEDCARIAAMPGVRFITP